MNQMNITVTCPTNHAAVIGQQITMSSREIAKLVDSRHSNVCVTIERLMKSGVIGGYAAMQYTQALITRRSQLVLRDCFPRLVKRACLVLTMMP